ncbi:hypothetical protein V8E36_008523 [Tilletia maclaganii]
MSGGTSRSRTAARLRTPPQEPAWSALLSGLSPNNAAAIRRLAATPSAPSQKFDKLTHKAQAAVAVFLYEQPYHSAGEHGDGQQEPVDFFPPGSRPNLSFGEQSRCSAQRDGTGAEDGAKVLHVLMTTRALHLRSHPGQASLPGGKRDLTDLSIEHTALRESIEEVGMSGWDSVGKEVHWLYTAPPLLSKTCLIIHPVVFFLSAPQRTLGRLRASPSEVSAIWSAPLPLFLASSPTHALLPEGYRLADPTQVDKHRPAQHALRTYSEVPWLLGRPYRLHRFRSSQQLIKGLTADALIELASVAYGVEPRFQVRAPGQMGWDEMVDTVLTRLGQGKRGESRWGDGESGDAQGSTEAFETIAGVDLPLLDGGAESGSAGRRTACGGRRE